VYTGLPSVAGGIKQFCVINLQIPNSQIASVLKIPNCLSNSAFFQGLIKNGKRQVGQSVNKVMSAPVQNAELNLLYTDPKVVFSLRFFLFVQI
jgi:hypothetical protein